MCSHEQNGDKSRREFLADAGKYSLLAGLSNIIPVNRAIGAPRSSRDSDRHFFLHIHIPFGLDNNYLFDSRPLEMTTEQKIIANYHGKDPEVYTGSNGQSTLRTTLTEPLMKWKEHFTVLNGVVMNLGLPGHENGTNVIFSGKPFGGDYFGVYANQRNASLDFVKAAGTLQANIQNMQAAMTLSPAGCIGLSKSVQEIAGKSELLSAVQRRADRVGLSKSTMGFSAKKLSASLAGLPSFAREFGSLNLDPGQASGESPEGVFLSSLKADMQMFMELMRVGVTDNAVLPLSLDTAGLNVDTHDPMSARAMPAIANLVSRGLALVFEILYTTQSPSGRRMLDDTTILIGSEFTRTMRNRGEPVENTGTDHNPLSNTLIVAGRGIKGGQVMGQSDFRTHDETLSPLHVQSDPLRMAIMGRPFDAASGRVIENYLPESYDPAQFLTPMNVTNTIQQILGIPAAKRFTYGQNMPAAPIIPALLG